MQQAISSIPQFIFYIQKKRNAHILVKQIWSQYQSFDSAILYMCRYLPTNRASIARSYADSFWCGQCCRWIQFQSICCFRIASDFIDEAIYLCFLYLARSKPTESITESAPYRLLDHSGYLTCHERKYVSLRPWRWLPAVDRSGTSSCSYVPAVGKLFAKGKAK